MPEYIRDFVDTRPLIKTAQAVESTAVYEWIFGESDPTNAEKGLASLMATVNPDERHEIVLHVEKLARASADGSLDQQALETASRELLQSKLRLTSGEIKEHLKIEPLDLQKRSQVAAAMQELKSIMPDNVRDREQVMAAIGESFEAASGRLREDDLSLRPGQMARLLLKGELSAEELTSAAIARIEANPVVDRMIIAGRQVNPEYIVNINAGAIVLFQVLISFFMGRFHRFTTMIVGMLIAAVGIGLSTFSGTEGTIGQGGLIWIVAGGIFTFSFGEMMASPTSQEYVGRIAPAEKKALYMGYYFVAIALGNLFAGILKGEMMSKLAYEMNRPDLMWAGYGAIMLATAIIFMLYNKFALPKGTVQKLT
jgi:hypothetical protein